MCALQPGHEKNWNQYVKCGELCFKNVDLGNIDCRLVYLVLLLVSALDEDLPGVIKNNVKI